MVDVDPGGIDEHRLGGEELHMEAFGGLKGGQSLVGRQLSEGGERYAASGEEGDEGARHREEAPKGGEGGFGECTGPAHR
jgi:hypothetical protein